VTTATATPRAAVHASGDAGPPPLVLVHGAGGASDDWQSTQAAKAKDRWE
jgi:pimeloyl-ACP methyl ester carboxylesterase